MNLVVNQNHSHLNMLHIVLEFFTFQIHPFPWLLLRCLSEVVNVLNYELTKCVR